MIESLVKPVAFLIPWSTTYFDINVNVVKQFYCIKRKKTLLKKTYLKKLQMYVLLKCATVWNAKKLNEQKLC